MAVVTLPIIIISEKLNRCKGHGALTKNLSL
jgi:hypothetical protein